LVVGWQRASNFVYQRVRSGANCCGFKWVGPVRRVIVTGDEPVLS
jgi:hypothetical protein